MSNRLAPAAHRGDPRGRAADLSSLATARALAFEKVKYWRKKP
jgi:hypothetical protein